jgi:hypothetical protein
MITGMSLVVAELGGVAVRTVKGVAVGLRKNVATLDATELADLRSAFTTAYGLSDDRGYAFYAGCTGCRCRSIAGSPILTGQLCPARLDEGGP